MKDLLKKYPKARTLVELFYYDTGIWGEFPFNRPKFEAWITKHNLEVIFDKYSIPIGASIT